MLPSLTACTSLVSESTNVIAFITKEIAVTWNIKSIGPPSEIIVVKISIYCSAYAYIQVMVHYIMPQFTTAAAKTIRPYIRGRIHQYPSTVQRRSIYKNNLCFVFVGFVCFRIQYFYTGSS